MKHDKCAHGKTMDEDCEVCKKLYEIEDRKDARIARLRAALEAVEWVLISDYGDIEYRCPWCEMSKYSGHADDCQRQAALKG